VLGLFLMAYFKGQIIVEDFGFYGRDAHIGLIRENRLITGVNFQSSATGPAHQGQRAERDDIRGRRNVGDVCRPST
jgi:hypothetical protein